MSLTTCFVHISGDAAAGLPVTVTSNASITSISPTSGSTNGGQILTITGYGFGDSTSVDISGSDCEVLKRYSVFLQFSLLTIIIFNVVTFVNVNNLAI